MSFERYVLRKTQRSIYEQNLARPILRGYFIFKEGELHLEKQLMFCSSGNYTRVGTTIPKKVTVPSIEYKH